MELSSLDHIANEVDLTLARATLYSALALGFRVPTAETIERLTSEASLVALVQAASVLEADPQPCPLPRRARGNALSAETTIEGSDSGLIASVWRLAATEQLPLAQLQSAFHHLFGHTARGAVPPYETEYGNEALFQQPQEMGDLMGFYRAFGLTLKLEGHERCDHISCECEFLTFLALKEAYALEHQETDMLEETRKATRLFLKEHLGRFLPTFAKKLSREDRLGFYGALAELALRFVTRESSRLSVTLGAMNLALRPADDDRVPMACGSGAECTAMPGACIPEGAEPV